MLEWQNLVFLLAIALGLMLALGTMLGLGDDHDAHGDGDGHHDGHHDGDNKGSPLDVAPHQSQSLIMRLLTALGYGRVPLTILIMMVCFIFGISGFISNQFLAPMVSSAAVYGSTSIAIAIACTVLLNGRLARLFNRVMPTTETYAVGRHQLVGMIGELVLPAGPDKGVAHVRDQAGDLHKVHVRTETGELPDGASISIIDYDADSNTYVVTAFNEK